MNTNNIFTILACCAVIVCVGCKRETKDEKIKNDIEQFTQKECPKFFDPCTRLDSACYDIASRTLSYHYTVQDVLDDETIYTEEVTDAFRENTLRELRNSIQLKTYKDEGITFRYDYRSITTGKMLLELTFTKEDY